MLLGKGLEDWWCWSVWKQNHTEADFKDADVIAAISKMFLFRT